MGLHNCIAAHTGADKSLARPISRCILFDGENISFFSLSLSWRYNPHRGLYFTALWRASASSLARFHDHVQRRATVGRTPLNEWSVRRIDLYLITHKHSQHTNIQALSGIRTHDRSRRAAVDLCLRPRGHWDRLNISLYISEFKHQFQAQDTTDLDAHFGQHYEKNHHRCCMGFCASLKAYFLT